MTCNNHPPILPSSDLSVKLPSQISNYPLKISAENPQASLEDSSYCHVPSANNINTPFFLFFFNGPQWLSTLLLAQRGRPKHTATLPQTLTCHSHAVRGPSVHPATLSTEARMLLQLLPPLQGRDTVSILRRSDGTSFKPQFKIFTAVYLTLGIWFQGSLCS